MGFLSGLVSAAVKTALTPVAVVKDAASVLIDEEPNSTKKLIESAAEDITDAFDDFL